MTEIPGNAWTGLYRAGQHGGGDCVYHQTGPEPTKQDPRVCIAFPAVDEHDRVVASGAEIAVEIINALNASCGEDFGRATGWLIMPADHDAGWNTIVLDAAPDGGYQCAGCGHLFIARDDHVCPGGAAFIPDKPGTFTPSEHRFMIVDAGS